MQFQDPSGLWLLGALPVAVWLHWKLTRRRRWRVPSLLLYRARQDAHRSQRSIWRAMLTLPLVVQLLVLFLLACIAARPVTTQAVPAPTAAALIIDSSASMSARTPSGSSAFERAVAAGLDHLRALPPGTRVTLLGVAGTTQVLASGQTDPTRLRHLLSGYRASGGTGDLKTAVALARSHLSAHSGPRQIAVFTDGADLANFNTATSEVPVRVYSVGTDLANVGLSEGSIELRRNKGEGLSLSIGVRVSNHSQLAATVSIALRPHKSPTTLRETTLSLQAEQQRYVQFTLDAYPTDVGTGLVLELSPHDALGLDDWQFLVVPEPQQQLVALSTHSKTESLRRALLADDSVRLIVADPEAIPSLPSGTLFVTEGECPTRVVGMHFLTFNPPAGRCHGVQVGDLVSAPSVTSWRDTDPRLRFVDLGTLNLERTRLLAGTSPKDALVHSSLGPIIASGSGSLATVIGFNPKETNWPLLPSFVLFVRNAVEVARAWRLAHSTPQLVAGDPLPSGVKDPIRWYHPTQSPQAEPLSPEVPGDAHLARHSGFYFLPQGGQASRSRLVAVNSPQNESDLRLVAVNAPKSESNLPSASAPTSSSGLAPEVPYHIDEQSIVMPLAWMVALLLLFELWLQYHGRTRRRPIEPRVVWWGLALGLLAASPPWLLELLSRASESEPALRIGLWWLSWIPPAVVVGVLWLSRSTWAPRFAIYSRLRVSLACITILLTTLLCIELQAKHRGDQIDIIVALDQSRSTSLVQDVQERIRREIKVMRHGRKPGDRLGIVAFASTAALAQAPIQSDAVPTLLQTALDESATNLEDGLMHALLQAREDAPARVVLISDGNATRGRVARALVTARDAHIPVDVVPLDPAPTTNLRIVNLTAPHGVTLGEAVSLRAVIASTLPIKAVVQLLENERIVRSSTLQLGPGQEVIDLTHWANSPGLQRYEVRIKAVDKTLDQLPEDNRRSVFVRVAGRSKALVLGRSAAAARPLLHALRRTGMEVEFADEHRLERALENLPRYDLIALRDLPKSALDEGQLQQVESYVRSHGGGLILLGGPSSLGPGGFAGTALERISPVTFDSDISVRRAKLAQVLAIDSSGSMATSLGQQTKLQLAHRAATQTAALIPKDGSLGIAHFGESLHWTLRPTSPFPDGLSRTLLDVQAGGAGAYLDPALPEIYRALSRTKAETRHAILLIDGADAERAQRSARLAAAAHRNKITTSVIALGSGRDKGTLARIAQAGGGRFHAITDPKDLTTILGHETQVSAERSIHLGAFSPTIVQPDGPLKGVVWRNVPQLDGQVFVLPKTRSALHLAGVANTPLLSSWSVGLGRVAVFTSDYSSLWSSRWVTWDGAAQLFGQLGRYTARRTNHDDVSVGAVAERGELFVSAQTPALDERTLEVHVSGPNNFRRTGQLRRRVDGRHEAKFILNTPGVYFASISEAENATPQVWTAAAEWSPAEEFASLSSDRATLAHIASQTGGKLRDSLAGVFRDRDGTRRAMTPVVRLPAFLATIALLATIASRRLLSAGSLPPLLYWRRRRTEKKAAARPGAASTSHTPAAEPSLPNRNKSLASRWARRRTDRRNDDEPAK